MKTSDFLILAICCFGLTYLLRYTYGPFNIFKKFRELCGMQYNLVYDAEYEVVMNYDEVEVMEDDKFITKLISCFWCFTTWISIIMYVIYLMWNPILYFCIPFGLIGLSGAIHNMVHDG